jgi:hypothetical protein
MRHRIGQLDDNLLARHPLQACVDIYDAEPDCRHYAHVDPRLLRTLAAVVALGPVVSGEYHKLLLLELIAARRSRIAASNLPVAIKTWYERNFTRIVEDAAQTRQTPEFYHHANDQYLKDLGLCAGRIIPAGAQKLNRYKLPIGALKRGGFAQLSGAAATMFRMGGLSPVFDMHTDSHDPELLAEFSPEGWRQFYLNVATLLAVQTDVRGLFGIGWFFDPEVARISPRLGYLRDLVTESGGHMFKVGETAGAQHSALATSPTRRQLHAEGKYHPTDYMAVWTRGALMGWSRACASTPA